MWSKLILERKIEMRMKVIKGVIGGDEESLNEARKLSFEDVSTWF